MIATIIEQSKKLLELGLDPKTADMRWFTETEYEPKLYVGFSEEWYEAYLNTNCTYIPAWSLDALFELLPIGYFKLVKNELGMYKMSSNIYVNNTAYNHSIEAVYNIVCILLENNLIKSDKK